MADTLTPDAFMAAQRKTAAEVTPDSFMRALSGEPQQPPAGRPSQGPMMAPYSPGILERIMAPIREGAIGRAFGVSTETAEARREDPSNPLLRFEAATPHPGAMRGAAEFASGLTTPDNLLIMAGTGGLGALEKQLGKGLITRLISGGFSADMLHGAYQQIPALRKAWDEQDWPQVRQQLVKMTLGTGMAGLAARHALKGAGGAAKAGEAKAAPEQEYTITGRPIRPDLTPDEFMQGERNRHVTQPEISRSEPEARPEAEQRIAAGPGIVEPGPESRPGNEGGQPARSEAGHPAVAEAEVGTRQAVQSSGVPQQGGPGEQNPPQEQPQKPEGGNAGELAFRSSQKPSSIVLNDLGILYTTPSEQYSKNWGPHTQRLTISPKRTLDLTQFSHDAEITPDEFISALQSSGVKVAASLADKLSAVESAEPLQYFGQFGRKPLVDAIRAAGYDSAKINEYVEGGGRSTSTLLFDASLAKPAPSESTAQHSLAAPKPEPPAPVSRETAPAAPSVEGAKAEAGPREREPGWIGNIPRTDVKVDAPRFQFKQNVGQGGVGDEFREVTKWDPEKAGILSVWKDPANGETYAVNGHHRVDMANRAENAPEVLPVRYLEAKTAQEARLKGALINIAEGHGESTDAAKVFRDSGMTLEELRAQGVSLKGKVTSEGLALSKLAQPIFDDVISGELSAARGAVIGAGVEGHADQQAVYDLLKQQEKGGRRLTNDQIGELIRLNNGAPTITESTANDSQGGLFGVEEMARSLLPEKARVSDYVRKQLGTEKRLFGAVGSQAAAEKLAEAGNVIKAGENAQVAERANQGISLYDKLSTKAGPIAQALDRAAQSIADGENENEVKQRAYQQIRSGLRAQADQLAGVSTGNDRGVEGGAPRGSGEAGAGEQPNPRLIRR